MSFPVPLCCLLILSRGSGTPPARPSTQAAKGATGDSAEVTYVAKASHLAKISPLTMSGTKAALWGYSGRIKDGVGRKYRSVFALSLSLPVPYLLTLHAHLHQHPLTEFNAMCSGSIEHRREASSATGLVLLWKCTISCVLRGTNKWRHGTTCLK